MGKGPIEDPHPQSASSPTPASPTLQQALEAGETTSTELTETLLARIAAIDTAGPRLHAVLAVDEASRRDRAATATPSAPREPSAGRCTASRSS